MVLEKENLDFQQNNQLEHHLTEPQLPSEQLTTILKNVASTSSLTKSALWNAITANEPNKYILHKELGLLLDFFNTYSLNSSGRMVCFLPSKYFAIKQVYTCYFNL